MITSNYTNTANIAFKADQNPIAGAAFAPKREELVSMEAHNTSKEQVLHLNPLKKLGLSVKKVGYDIPTSIARGLQGDRSVSFHEFLQMAALPYYLGGAMLFNCFRAGGDIATAKKQGAGVALYYAGIALGNKFVNGFVKQKYGVDLDLAYRAENGSIHKVFESADFTRWDLLKQEDWDKLGDKLGIPRDVVDRDTAVKTEVGKILVKARAWKLVLGATFAATGAGFIARNKGWENLGGNLKAITSNFKNIFNGNSSVSLANKAREFGGSVISGLKSEVVKPIVDSLKDLPTRKLGNVPVGKIALAALVLLPLMSIISLIRTPNRNKTYITKQEAMPDAIQIEKDEQLRKATRDQINPNKTDYEALYTQAANGQNVAAAKVHSAAQQVQDASPFDIFEAFMKAGV